MARLDTICAATVATGERALGRPSVAENLASAAATLSRMDRRQEEQLEADRSARLEQLLDDLSSDEQREVA